MPNTSNTRLLDTAAAAAELNLSLSTLTKWRVTGAGPSFIKLGAAVRYDRAAIEAFKNASVRRSTSEQVAA